MVGRSVAAADVGGGGDGGGDKIFRLLHRVDEGQAAGQAGREGRAQRAAGAVGVGRVDFRGGEPADVVLGDQHVIGSPAGEVAARNENGPGAVGEQPAPGGHHVVASAHRHARQGLGFGHVGRDDGRQGQQMLPQRRDGRVFQQRVAALGDHDRVHHQAEGAGRTFAFPGRVPGQPPGHGVDNVRVDQHAGLDGIDADVRQDGFQLCIDLLGGHRIHARDTSGVLRGDGGDDRHAVRAQRRKRLQVRLNARAAAGIRAGHGERAGGARGQIGAQSRVDNHVG